jgi:O-antigen ligase
MPPIIALFLCILFILYLFKIDFKRESHVSMAIWVPTIWLMIISSRPISLWLNPGTAVGTSEGSPLDRFIYLIFILISVYIISRRDVAWPQMIKSNAMIFSFFLYAGISIMWSDYPYVSFKRWIKGIGTLTMILIVLTDIDPLEALMTIIRRTAFVLIPLSIVFIKYFPIYGRSYSIWTGEVNYSGVAYNKNSLGYLCLICGFFFVWNLLQLWNKKENDSIHKREIYVNILFLIMITWLLKMANSATSLISLIIGIGILICFNVTTIKKNATSHGLYIFLIIICVLPFLFLDSGSLISFAVNTTGHGETFWGRSEMWKYLIGLDTNPLIGTGYESFWLGNRAENLWKEHWWHPNQAHNGYIEIYLNMGWIGLILLIGVIVTCYRNILSVIKSNFEYGRFRMAFLMIVLLFNVTEAGFKGLHPVWFTFLLLSMNYQHTLVIHNHQKLAISST